MTKQLPPITPKQQTILQLIYKYRFLNRTQIQALLKHKDKRRILSWLKDLREKDYLNWQYNPNDFITKTKPAIYYLLLNGIRQLKSTEQYPEIELRKRYKDSTRTQGYIEQSILIADCCITLESNNNEKVDYTYIVEADYIDPDNQYHFLNDLKPDLYFIKTIQSEDETTTYLLEIFASTTPRYAVRKKLSNYIEYLSEAKPNQIVLLAFETTAELLYAKRRVRLLLDEKDIPKKKRSNIRFSTIDKITLHGVSGIIWEEI